MATPNFNLNYTVISTCDSDNWDGGIGAVEPDIKKQGTNSLAVAVRDDGSGGISGTWDMSATDTHLRLWVQYTFPATLDLKANGGIQLWVSDGTNTNYYYVGGSDTHNGSWELMQCDLASPDVDGSATLSAITSAGWEIVNATAARNVVNMFWDYFVFGTGYEIYGGTSGDKITWADLATADRTNGYGMVQEVNGVYFINGELKLGDSISTNDCYFDGDSELAVFYSANESTTLYKIEGTGNSTGTTDISIQGTVIKSAANRFVFDMNGANLTTFIFDASKLDNAGLCYFKASQTITNSVFTNCLQIDPSTSTFQKNTISNYIGTEGGALLWADSSNTKDLIILNCDNGIEFTTTSTPKTFDNIIFDDEVGNFDVNDTSGSAVTVNLTNGSNANSYNTGGSVVTFASSVLLSMTVTDESGTEISGALAYIDDNNSTPFIMNTTTDALGVASATWTGGAVTGATWRIRKYGFKPYKATSNISTINKDIPVTLIADPQQT